MNKKTNRVPRRTFLKRVGAAAGVGLVGGAPAVIPSGVLAAPGRKGANDRIYIGHIGMGGRARGLWRELGPLRDKGEAVSVAICDVDQRSLARTAKDSVAEGATIYHDYRRLLEHVEREYLKGGRLDLVEHQKTSLGMNVLSVYRRLEQAV